MKVQIKFVTDTFNSYPKDSLNLEGHVGGKEVWIRLGEDEREVSVLAKDLLATLKMLVGE